MIWWWHGKELTCHDMTWHWHDMTWVMKWHNMIWCWIGTDVAWYWCGVVWHSVDMAHVWHFIWHCECYIPIQGRPWSNGNVMFSNENMMSLSGNMTSSNDHVTSTMFLKRSLFVSKIVIIYKIWCKKIIYKL